MRDNNEDTILSKEKEKIKKKDVVKDSNKGLKTRRKKGEWTRKE